MDQAKRLKDLDRENARLKKLLAEVELTPYPHGHLETTARKKRYLSPVCLLMAVTAPS